MSPSNSVESIRNKIKEIILLEKNADVFFNDILEPFVNAFFDKRFKQLGKLDDTFLEKSDEDEKGLISKLYFGESPETGRENVLEMLRYVVLVELIKFMRLNNDELSKFVNKDLANSGQNVIKNYLNLNNNELVNKIENFFLYDQKVFDCSPHYYKWLYSFLEQIWPKKTIDTNDEKEIVNILLKLMTSRFIHIKSTETEKTNFSQTIDYFIYSSCGRFLSNSGSYADYLYKIGDLENLLFNPKSHFIELFRIDDKRAEFYKEHLSAESLKARFDRDVVWACHKKNLFRKIIASIKYYCWAKWIALFADRFCKNQTTVTAIVDNQLSTDSNANVNLALSVRTNYEQNEPRGQDNSQTEL